MSALEIDTGLEALVALGERNGLGHGSMDEARREALDRVLAGYDSTTLGVAAERLGSLDTSFLDRMARQLPNAPEKVDWRTWASRLHGHELFGFLLTQQNLLLYAISHGDWPGARERAADLADLAMFVHHHAETKCQAILERL